MSSNSIGKNFTFTTWGESHGKAIGCVIDGVPSNIKLEEKDIQPFLDKRKPGQSKYTTQRQEDDKVEILSGVFEGLTTGHPISLIINNRDQRSKDYSEIKINFDLDMLIIRIGKNMELEIIEAEEDQVQEKPPCVWQQEPSQEKLLVKK